MNNLENKIEEAAKKYATINTEIVSFTSAIKRNAFAAGAKSEESKEFHTQALKIEMVAKCTKMQVELKKNLYTEEEVKSIATKFFYHWYNTNGTNTEEGFDKWFETNKKK